MATFLVYDIEDSEGLVSPFRLRIEDQDVPADVTTVAAAIATAAFGVGKPSLGGIKACRLEIDGVHAPTSPGAACDIRNNWQMSMVDVDGAFYRVGLPARNLLTTLIATGSKMLAALDTAPWPALDTALTGGVIHTENPQSGQIADAIAKSVSAARSRKRVREGGSR